jgi:hypothetical protein
MDYLYPPYADKAPKDIYAIAKATPVDQPLVMVIAGTNVEGNDIRKTVAVQLGKAGEGRQRLAEAGLTFGGAGDEIRITGVKFGTRAKKAGWEQGWEVTAIKVPTVRPSGHWVYLPALAIVALVYFLQRARLRSNRVPPTAGVSS